MSRKVVYRIMILSALAAFTVACGAKPPAPGVRAQTQSVAGQ